MLRQLDDSPQSAGGDDPDAGQCRDGRGAGQCRNLESVADAGQLHLCADSGGDGAECLDHRLCIIAVVQPVPKHGVERHGTGPFRTRSARLDHNHLYDAGFGAGVARCGDQLELDAGGARRESRSGDDLGHWSKLRIKPTIVQ